MYSSEGTQRELSNEYQGDNFKCFFFKSLCPCALKGNSLSIGRVKIQRFHNKRAIGTKDSVYFLWLWERASHGLFELIILPVV